MIMNYLQKKMPDGKIAIYREMRDKQGDKVHIWTGKSYKDEKRAYRIMWAFEMVSSIWAYDGKNLDSRYLQKYYDEGVSRKVIEAEFDWLAHNTDTVYAGEDSEGITYRAIVYAPRA